MVSIVGTLGFCFLLQLLLQWVSFKLHRPAGDHYYHIGIVRGIKENGHRLLRSHPNLLGEENFGYPQGMHWLYSFLNENFLIQYKYLPGLIIGQIQVLVIALFSYLIFKEVGVQNPIQSSILATILYILTPFNYAVWNSKNSGYSTRQLGIVLVSVYLFCVVLLSFETSFSLTLNGLILMAVFLILFTTQFGLQFIILSLLPIAAYFKDPMILVDFGLAIGLFLIIGKAVSVRYLKAQLAHKVLYFNYLYLRNILVMRRTIWKELILDIWLFLKDKPIDNLAYVLHNPFLSITILMPTNLVLATMFILGDPPDESQIGLLMPLLVSLGIFMLTSFKRLRFLGEPERYVEMAFQFGIIVIVGMSSTYSHELKQQFINGILLYSSGLISVQFYLIYRRSKSFSPEESPLLLEIRNYVSNRQLLQGKMMCNDASLINSFMESRWQIQRPILTSTRTHGHEFPKFYNLSNFRIFTLKSIKAFMEFEDFNVVVLKKSLCNEEDIYEFEASLSLTRDKESRDLIFYRLH